MLVACGLLVACGAAAPSQSPEAVVVREMADEEPEPVPEPEPVTTTTAPSFGTISLLTGFLPDPAVAEGRLGGTRDATSLDVGCVGWIDQAPGHTLDLRVDFSWLRVMVKSVVDATLVVRSPDGRLICNDDFDGLNPAVDGAFAAGVYEIWVGSYEQGVQETYRLGVSELQSVTPSTL